ncbi:bifunctional DNA primase/polymerase [Methylobacterium sp. CM6246]
MNMIIPPASGNLNPAEAAKIYVGLGMELLVVHPLTKQPVNADWPNRPGVTDPIHAGIMFLNPEQNIGFKPGDLFAAIDIDTKHGGKGRESWAELNERLGPFPDTVEAVTASGGGLRIYSVPAGANLMFQKKMLGLPDLEFRVGAVNCILPPSRVQYPDGMIGQHRWKADRAPGEIKFAELPSVVVEALRDYELKVPKVTTKAKGTVGGVSAMLRDQAKKAAISKAKPDSLASVLAGCAWMEHCEADAASLSEPEWHSMLSISARCENGRELSHKLSEPYADYSSQETEDKIDHALNDAGPVTCKKVANELGFEGCARCPFSITSPISLANQPRALVKVQRGTVFIQKGRVYYVLASGEKLDPQEFADGVRAKVGPQPHDKLVGSPTMPIVARREYLPGNPNLILHQEDGTKAVNMWQGAGVIPVEGDASPILDYFDRLIPIPSDRQFLIQYLAHLYRHPEVKIEFGAIITGGFGSGKSTFHRLVKGLFGQSNARKLEGAELASTYNARWVDCQVLMVEEAHHGERLEVFKSTLELLVAEHIHVHDKYVRQFQGRTPRGITLVSNDEAPIVLPPGDRRWFVTSTLPTPETEEEKREHRAFFKRLYEVLDRDDTALAAFAYHIMHEVDLKGFEPKGTPLMTAAKETATTASRTPVAQVLAELISTEAAPFHKDILEVKEVVHALKMSDYANTLERISPQKIANVIRAVSGKQVNMEDGKHMELVIGGGKKIRPWAIRNTARWATASREELKAEFLRLPGDAGANVADIREAAFKRAMEEAARRTGG